MKGLRMIHIWYAASINVLPRFVLSGRWFMLRALQALKIIEIRLAGNFQIIFFIWSSVRQLLLRNWNKTSEKHFLVSNSFAYYTYIYYFFFCKESYNHSCSLQHNPQLRGPFQTEGRLSNVAFQRQGLPRELGRESLMPTSLQRECCMDVAKA